MWAEITLLDRKTDGPAAPSHCALEEGRIIRRAPTCPTPGNSPSFILVILQVLSFQAFPAGNHPMTGISRGHIFTRKFFTLVYDEDFYWCLDVRGRKVGE